MAKTDSAVLIHNGFSVQDIIDLLGSRVKRQDAIAKYKKILGIKKPYKIYHGKGCKYCNNQGIKGRVAIFEALSVTTELEKIIVEHPTEGAIREESHRQEMMTILQDGIIKAIKGVTTINEVLKATKE